jgi:hypothetical protein
METEKMEHAALAEKDFEGARRRAIAAGIRSRLSGRRDDLLPYEAVRELVRPSAESYAGLQSIPVDRIVGSERRSPEFSRDFLPRRAFLRRRWQSIDIACYESKPLPAIRVFELGGVYFVRDGNHRVSVAHALKRSFIDAEVVRVRTDVVLDPRMSLGDVGAAALRARSEPTRQPAAASDGRAILAAT